MSRLQVERRDFLKTTALAAAALGTSGWAQAEKHAATANPEDKPAGPKVAVNPRDLGATGDGKTKDTLALQLAIDRCSVLGGGVVAVPAGEYLTGALQLHSNVTLRLEEGATLHGADEMADYPVAQVRWEGRWIKGYSAFISAMDAENIAIEGPGKIQASPAIRGRVERPSGLRLPALIEFVNCRNVRVENCSATQTGMWAIHPVYCENIVFKNVTIVSGADGIDADSCKEVTIDGCSFETDDDCISLKSGRGMEANTINRPCENVRIANCTFIDRHFACIGIGSEVSAGVRNVVIEHCKCLGARSHAIYIKSREGRGAFIENIAVNDFEVSGAQQGFLRINSTGSGKQDEFPVPGDRGIPTFRNFRFTNIRVHDVPVLVQAVEIHPRKPLDGLSLANITGTAQSGMKLANIKNVEIRDVKVTGIDGAMLSIANVTGTGLEGAEKLDESKLPKLPDAVAGPATPYVLK
jgi:polygalacturonase